MELNNKEKEEKAALIRLLTKHGYTDQEIKDFYYRRNIRLQKKNSFNEQERTNPTGRSNYSNKA